jgi:hypothetical protein
VLNHLSHTPAQHKIETLEVKNRVT